MRYSNSRFGSLFGGRNLIVLALVIAAFYMLNSYRNNDPLSASTLVPDFMLRTADNQTFMFHDIKMPKILVFFNEHEYLSNNIYSSVYQRQMPSLKFLQEEGAAQIIILIKNINTVDELNKLYENSKYEYMKNISYVADDNVAVAFKYGIRSWPHVYIIDGNNRVRDSAKILSTEKLTRRLYRYL